jgi:hypothetical protein
MCLSGFWLGLAASETREAEPYVLILAFTVTAALMLFQWLGDARLGAVAWRTAALTAALWGGLAASAVITGDTDPGPAAAIYVALVVAAVAVGFSALLRFIRFGGMPWKDHPWLRIRLSSERLFRRFAYAAAAVLLGGAFVMKLATGARTNERLLSGAYDRDVQAVGISLVVLISLMGIALFAATFRARIRQLAELPPELFKRQPGLPPTCSRLMAGVSRLLTPPLRKVCGPLGILLMLWGLVGLGSTVLGAVTAFTDPGALPVALVMFVVTMGLLVAGWLCIRMRLRLRRERAQAKQQASAETGSPQQSE